MLDQHFDLAEKLARDLPRAGVKKSVIGDAYAYLTQAGGGSFGNWLNQYKRLTNEQFASGKTSAQQRKAFVDVIKGAGLPTSEHAAWGQIIGWTQRLYSDADLTRPAYGRREQPKPKQAPKVSKPYWEKVEIDEPEVRDEVSDDALAFLRLLQNKEDK